MTSRPRLGEATLARLPPDVERPGYERQAVRAGVVHIGPGAFHRAHQAPVFDDLIRRGDRRWGITALALRSGAAGAALTPQDGLYGLARRRAEGDRLRIVGALRRVMTLGADPLPLVEALAEPRVAIVTLTVTEAGYRPQTPGGPATAAGLIAAALGLRRSRGHGGVTVISCDNLSGNGDRIGSLVLDAAAAIDPALADWARATAAFPNAMVDRITPATTAEDLEAVAARTGLRDEALVRPETFSQWVIEDRFANPPPDFGGAGVQVVRDVRPFERAKLRLLNGAHSAMAYLGGLAGLAFVHEFVAKPDGAAFIERLWDEAQTTLESATLDPAALDLRAYRQALARRFADPVVAHRLAQIAIDGSQKLPQRLLAPLAERLARGRDSPALALAVAAWIRWRSGRDDEGAVFVTPDVMDEALRRRLSGQRDPAARVEAVMAVPEIFAPPLAADARVRAALTAALAALDEAGAASAMARLAAG